MTERSIGVNLKGLNQMKKYIVCLLCLTLAACANTANTEEISETAALTTTASQTTTELKETSAETTSQTDEEYDYYMNLGVEKGMYFSEIGEKYFHTSFVGMLDKTKEQLHDFGADRHLDPILGLDTGKDEDGNFLYDPMDYDELKEYFHEMGISEHAFKSFQRVSYGAFYNIDGQLYEGRIDGGLWGWDCSYIDSYVLCGEDTVVYNCVWIGYAGSYEDGFWDYEEDKTEPFTFTLRKENDEWMLFDCSNTYAFFAYFVGLEENYSNKYYKPE